MQKIKNILPLLSICIPTYMRAENIYKQVLNILSCEGDIEVVVSDNCSDDNTLELLKSINDKRLIILENEINKGSLKNGLKAMSKASGKYVMLMMDKDYLKMQNIDKILNYLQKNDFALGYFDLYLKENEAFEILRYKNNYDCLAKFAYLSKHPTGYIFNNKMLRTLDIENRFSDMDKVGAFAFEFIAAELAIQGDCVIFKIPFCGVNLPPFEGLKHSFTFSPDKENIYFMPKQRIDIFEKFVKHLNVLHISYITRFRVLKLLTKRTYTMCTSEYKRCLASNVICDWYNINNEIRSNNSIEDVSLDFVKMLECSDLFINFFEKYNIIRNIKRKHNKMSMQHNDKSECAVCKCL